MNDIVKSIYDNAQTFQQFEQSQLQTIIMSVTGQNYKDAYISGTFHCNMLSTFLILHARGLWIQGYLEFFKKAYDNKWCTDHGYLNIDKKIFFEKMEINATLVKLDKEPVDLKPGDCFQIPVNNFHHFMASAVDDDLKIHLFDTHNLTYRQYGEELHKALAVHGDKPDYFNHIF